eukprot:scaffold13279_cov155-Skeletonema_menzelii.AAC.1
MGSLRQRRKAPELERQSSAESSSSNSSSKTHRRIPSSGWFSIGFSKIIGGDVSSAANDATTDPLNNLCWSSSCCDTFLPLHVDTTDYLPERKSRRRQSIGGGSDEGGERSLSPHEIEDLIRQLSFSPSRKTEKRNDTADAVTSFSSIDSSDTHYKHTMRYLRRRSSSSPLMAPDGGRFPFLLSNGCRVCHIGFLAQKPLGEALFSFVPYYISASASVPLLTSETLGGLGEE